MHQLPSALRTVVSSDDRDRARQWARTRLEPRARAHELRTLAADELSRLLAMLDPDSVARLLNALPSPDGARLFSHLDDDSAAEALQSLPPDKAADLVQSAGARRLPAVLGAMDPAGATELTELIRWPPDTAGGRMTPAYVVVTSDVRADEAVAGLRQVAAHAQTIAYVYVISADERLRGVLSLRNLVLSAPDTPVAELMTTDVVAVSPLTDQEVAARLLTEHDLVAIPVVAGERLLGIITADAVADILEEETTEDFSRLGGAQPLEQPYLQTSSVQLWRKRILWLLALFVAEAYTGTVLRYFERDLEAVVALAFFVPLLIGTGGNVGSQVTTTLVRAIGVGSVRLSDIFRVVRKESATGVLLAVVLAVGALLRALILDVGYDLALVVTLAVAVIVLWASVVGAILPLLLQRFRVDPAVVSAPLITTLVDGTGLLIYFGIARLIL